MLKLQNNNPSTSFLGTVSAPASVGASKLRLEVATGNPHPLHKGGFLLSVHYRHIFKINGKAVVVLGGDWQSRGAEVQLIAYIRGLAGDTVGVPL